MDYFLYGMVKVLIGGLVFYLLSPVFSRVGKWLRP